MNTKILMSRSCREHFMKILFVAYVEIEIKISAISAYGIGISIKGKIRKS